MNDEKFSELTSKLKDTDKTMLAIVSKIEALAADIKSTQQQIKEACELSKETDKVVIELQSKQSLRFAFIRGLVSHWPFIVVAGTIIYSFIVKYYR